jgi:hypothetical protein
MPHPSRKRPLILALGLLCLTAALTGCPGRARKPNIADVFVSNQRFSIDNDRGLVQVYGRLDNTGQSRFRQVEVHAILRSAGGEKRGENSLLLQNIKPLEKRNFSLPVTSHSRATDVILEVREPGQS